MRRVCKTLLKLTLERDRIVTAGTRTRRIGWIDRYRENKLPDSWSTFSQQDLCIWICSYVFPVQFLFSSEGKKLVQYLEFYVRSRLGKFRDSLKTLFLESRRLLSTNITMLQYRLMIRTGSAVIIRSLNTKQEQWKWWRGYCSWKFLIRVARC